MLDGRLSLITPEGISIAICPAGPGRRAFAWAIDTLLWLLFLTLLRIGLPSALGSGGLASGTFLICLFVSSWGYPVLCEVYMGGMTLGKRFMGLEVVRADALPVGWRESALRNLLLVADFLPIGYATGLVCMLADKQFRRLGDLVAGTVVIYHSKPKPRRVVTRDTAEPLPWPLSPEQQRALIDLVERAERLSPARRLELADLAEPLTGQRGQASLLKLQAYAAGLTQ